ncbi:hypothetical protein C7974DRAFT_373467 [Boeremia exigua]|uniref:uncharacterized protein n=1 Tax=Boeremia exigua TaxID=749465 RepID=UPI001E8E0582|nr:uncharacterized protein C7974DRAFT_373467 [Boeremia exigua]KAH6639204.1 hypothetical protein C7974DRAFT_373467 [Boeremia exigua]
MRSPTPFTGNFFTPQLLPFQLEEIPAIDPAGGSSFDPNSPYTDIQGPYGGQWTNAFEDDSHLFEPTPSRSGATTDPLLAENPGFGTTQTPNNSCHFDDNAQDFRQTEKISFMSPNATSDNEYSFQRHVAQQQAPIATINPAVLNRSCGRNVTEVHLQLFRDLINEDVYAPTGAEGDESIELGGSQQTSEYLGPHNVGNGYGSSELLAQPDVPGGVSGRQEIEGSVVHAASVKRQTHHGMPNVGQTKVKSVMKFTRRTKSRYPEIMKVMKRLQDASEVLNERNDIEPAIYPNPPAASGLHFSSAQAASVVNKIVYWEPPANDTTIPTTQSEREAWVVKLLTSIRNNQGCLKTNEKQDSQSFLRRWAPGATFYTATTLEAVAWQVLVSKSTCEDLIKGNRLVEIVGCPHVVFERIHGNNKSNKDKSGKLSEHMTHKKRISRSKDASESDPLNKDALKDSVSKKGILKRKRVETSDNDSDARSSPPTKKIRDLNATTRTVVPTRSSARQKARKISTA